LNSYLKIDIIQNKLIKCFNNNLTVYASENKISEISQKFKNRIYFINQFY